MYQTGICTIEDLARQQRRGIRHKEISYRLLAYGEMPREVEVAAFERVIRRARLAGGIYRTTYRGRMAAVDSAVREVLQACFSRDAALEIHDWAASDCLASAEWAAGLLAEFPLCRVTASDLHFYLVEAARGPESFIFEEGGSPLQYVRHPFVIDLNRPKSSAFLVNRWLLHRARRRIADAASAVGGAHWPDLADRRLFEFPPWRVARIPLVHPEAMRWSQGRGVLRLDRHSVFDALPSPVAVIRTMNILNRGYFSDDRLREGARAVYESLEEGGVWIVGRTAEEVTPPEDHVTIWKKAGGGFRELRRLGAGSEISDLARLFRPGSVA